MEVMKSIQGARHIGDLLRDMNIVLKGADVLSQRGFTQVPNHLLRSSKISAGAKLAYTMLLSYAWQNEFCFPGQERLAKDTRITQVMILWSRSRSRQSPDDPASAFDPARGRPEISF
jgi:hypothetical protein